MRVQANEKKKCFYIDDKVQPDYNLENVYIWLRYCFIIRIDLL